MSSGPAPFDGSAVPLVTVVVPALNAQDTIGRTLSALSAQQIDEGFEVIVVDGGSADATCRIVAEAGMTLLHNPSQEPAASRNLGANQGRGEVLAFTDADCEPAPDWLATGLRALRTTDIVQGRVRPLEARHPFDRTVEVNFEDGLYETANLFVRRTVFERVGGFEALPGLDLPAGSHFGEDVWFAWRAKRTGAASAFAPDAVVGHAVFRRKVDAFLREQHRVRYFPYLVGLIPELRQHFLFRRWFLSPASARFDLAAAGVAAAALSRRPGALLAALPYVSHLSMATRSADALHVGPGLLAADAIRFVALLRGSVSARTVVL